MTDLSIVGGRGGIAPFAGALPSFFSRLSFQLPGALFVAVLLPAFLRARLRLPLDHPTFFYAGLAAALAILLSCYFIRRVRDFPGAQSGVHIPLAVTGAFVMAFVALVLAQLEYDGALVAASYLLALGWFSMLHLLAERFARPLVGVVPAGHAGALTQLGGVRWRKMTRPEDLMDRLSAVAVDLRQEMSEDWERALTEATLMGLPVYHSKTLAESLTGKVEIEHLYENSFASILPSRAYLKLKFHADRLLALILLPLFAIVTIVVGLLILIDSKGPIFYRQERVGYRGRPFWVYKFRTMMPCRQAGGRQAAITRDDDTRITRVGRVLRRCRIDELPQLINILRGEMSWIGPRPEARALSEWYEAELPYYRYRHAVRPGISGWAQVNQGHVALPSEVRTKLHYDFFYIKYLSPWLDILIALRTVRTVIFGFGAK